MEVKRYLIPLFLLFCLPIRVMAKEESVVVHIPVSCEAKGVEESFTYVLSDAAGEIGRLALTDGTDGGFAVNVDKPGVTSYTVHQVKGSLQDMTYDKTVYCVDIHTVLEENGLISEPVIYVKGTDEKSDKCRFVNQGKAVDKTDEKPEKPAEKKQAPDPVVPASPWQKAVEIIKTGEVSTLELCGGLTLFVAALLLLFIHRNKEDE